MPSPPLIALAFAALAILTASPPRPAPPVDTALARWDMARARALAATMPRNADRCAVEGMIANRENRLGDAERLLSRCLPVLERVRSPRAEPAMEALLDTYRRRGDYGHEYKLIARWLHVHGEATQAAETAALRNELGMAAVLREGGRRAPTGSPTARLQSRVNPLRTRNVDLTVNGVTLPWMIDTGANYSVVSESAARRMGLGIRDASYQVAGSTGHTTLTRLAVIDRLPVGGIILHDVVAIVVPDAALLIHSARGDYQIEAALGYPALAQFGRFRIDLDGTVAIDRSAPLLRTGAPMYMNQLTPLAEVEIAGRKSLLSVDTGATRTTLYASYAARFSERASGWAKRPDTSLGMGGSIEADVAIEPQLTAVVGERSATERDVTVAMEGDGKAPVLGNLGLPLLAARGSYTFDFRSMRLLLGREAAARRNPRPRWRRELPDGGGW